MSNEIQELTAEIKKFSAKQQEQIDALRKILVGNGQIGLCETVRQVTDKVNNHSKIIYVVGGLLLSGLVKLIFFP